MIRKKLALDLIGDGYRFSDQIMLKKGSRRTGETSPI
jgi:hypothetical protein